MIPGIIIGLLLLTFVLYLNFLWGILSGLRTGTRSSNVLTPDVSVIVAARNEKSTITECILALGTQTYAPDKLEVIIVDDHSQDHTLENARIAAMQASHLNLTLLSCSDLPGHLGKPAAIAHGIAAAKGEIILCTDADCIVPKDWVASMVSSFGPDVAFVAGPVAEIPSSSWISKLQALEFLGLIATGAGLIASGKPIICNGANIAYRKAAFRSVNGFGESDSSCDDETLMQRMIQRKIGRIVFNFDPAATVTTATPATIADFWTQRTRWAAKSGHYEDPRILLRLVILYCFFLLALIAAVSSLFYPVIIFPLVGVILVKAAAEFTVLNFGARRFLRPLSLWHFLIAELFHVPYIVFAGLIGQLRTVRWKNRTFGQ